MTQKTHPAGRRKGKSSTSARRPQEDSSSKEGRSASSRDRLIEIQQTHGNAAVQQLLKKSATQKNPQALQRKPVAEEMKQPLAAITFQSTSLEQDAYPDVTNGTVKAEAELVPSWSKPGEFPGFERRVEAYGHAWAQTELTAVVEDGEGRYHAFKTGWPGRTNDQTRVSIYPFQSGFSKIWWVNVPGRGDPASSTGQGSWSDRAGRARNRYDLWAAGLYSKLTCPHEGKHGSENLSRLQVKKCLEEDFVQLLAEALDIRTADIHVAESYGDHRSDVLVNFDIEMGATHGESGGKVPIDRGAEMKRPTMAVGPSAFIDKNALYPLSTAIHEAMHVSHAMMAEDLFEQWRTTTKKGGFYGWLAKQLKTGKITQEQYDLAIDMTEGKSSDSELLAHLEGFLVVFQRAPKTEDSSRTENLTSISDYWGDAQPNTRLTVLKRLAALYRNVAPSLQKELADFIREQAASSRGEIDEDLLEGPFWIHAEKQVLSGG